MSRKPSALQRVVNALTGKPNLEDLRRRHDVAVEAVAQSERDLASISYDVEMGQLDQSHEDAALAAVAKAKAEAERLRAVVQEAERRDRQSAEDARAAREAAEDAKLAKAADAYLKSLTELAATLPAYGDAYRKTAQTGDALRGLIRSNPRARGDLAPVNPSLLVGEELARLGAGGGPLPPGTDTWASASRDPRTMQPVADQAADLVRAIKASVGQ